MAIGLDEASLVAIALESMLFGLLTAFFATTIYLWAVRKRSSRTMNKSVLSVSILMYCVAVAHLSIDARRVVYAFIVLSGGDESATDYFTASSDPMYLAKITMYFIQTFIGDAFIIYRLYTVWGRDLRLLTPGVVCLLASVACGTMALVDAARVSPTTLIFIPKLKQWIVSFFSLTLFTNISCTALIAFKIWWTGRQLGRHAHQRSLFPILTIVIESGMVYSASLISLMAAYTSGSWGHYIILDMMTQIIAITFSLIIVRIGMGISASNIAQQPRAVSHPNGGASYFNGTQEQFPVRSLVVHFASTRSVKDDQGNSVCVPSTEEEDPVKLVAESSESKEL